MDAENRISLAQTAADTEKFLKAAAEEEERTAVEEARDLRREKQELAAENAMLRRRLARAERKDASITLRLPCSLRESVSASARRMGFKSPAAFLFELLARLQGGDLETAFEAFDDPSFGTELDAMAHNLGCRPGEVLRVISKAMPGQIIKLCEERSRRQTGENRPDEQLS